MSVVSFLSRLVQARSFSGEEGDAAEVVRAELRAHGVSPESIDHNVVARHGSGGPVIWLNSHIDTVRPASGYTRDPWDGAHEEGCIWGLGSNDAKGSVAALTHAFLAFRARYPDFAGGTVMLLATAEEEVGGEGLKRMRRELPAPDAAIVGEPNEMQPAHACKGTFRAQVTVKGKSAHASRPWQGENALRKAVPVLAALAQPLIGHDDPDLGPPTHEPTLITTDTASSNVLPGSVRITVDCRTVPGFSTQAMQSHLQARLVPFADVDLTFETAVEAVRTDPGGSLVQAACHVAGTPQPTVFRGVCDFVYLAGIDAVVMGPGQGVRSHTANEFIRVDEVEAGVAGYLAVLERFFGLTPPSA